VLESEEIAQKYPGEYLKLAENFGTQRMSSAGVNVLVDLLKSEDWQIEDLFSHVRSESIRLVDQSKVNVMYYQLSKQKQFDCKLENEDVNDGFKKALIALQNKSQRSYAKIHDHVSQMLQVGKVSQDMVRENSDLVKETLDVIYDDIIPENQLVNQISSAFKVRKQARLGQ